MIKDALRQTLDTLIVLMNDESVSYDSWDKAKASETCADLKYALIEAELQAQQALDTLIVFMNDETVSRDVLDRAGVSETADALHAALIEATLEVTHENNP